MIQNFESQHEKRTMNYGWLSVLVTLVGFLSGCATSSLNKLGYISQLVPADKIVRVGSDGNAVDLKSNWNANVITFEHKSYDLQKYYGDERDKFRPYSKQLPIAGKDVLVSRYSCVPLDSKRNLLIGGFASENKKREVFAHSGDLGFGRLSALKNAWIVDTENQSTEEINPTAFARSDPNLSRLSDGRILISGGFENGNLDRPVDFVEVFDPNSKSFSTIGRMHLPRLHHSVIQLKDGLILVVGGQTTKFFSGDRNSLTATVEALDIRTNKFTLLGELHEARQLAILVPLEDDGVLICGGNNNHLADDFIAEPVTSAELIKNVLAIYRDRLLPTSHLR